jgi:hypothetical protein
VSFGINVISRCNRSVGNIKVFENFFGRILKIKEKKFQALRVKTLTLPTPRLQSSYDV